MKKRTVNVSISLPKSLRDAARNAAVDDQRSVSSLVASLLKDHLCAEGYISATLQPAERPFNRNRL
ncbi:hypothetical protein [Cerasicoccus arenae]|nr:hypothetical protein [Cerasicoccus arenae]MBK1859482.1 hypothetical protein [Cerasicoccus arenae]